MDAANNLLLQYGAIGAFLIIATVTIRALFLKLQANYDQERERADRLEQQLAELNETVRSQYMTTLANASQAIAESTRAVADALAAVRRS